MKNLKPAFKAFALILLLAFAACKKDGAVKPGPDPEPSTPVLASDLLPYDISLLLSVQSGLRIIYFNKEGNDIKATFDAVNFRRISTVKIVNNTWVLNLNGDGSVIYTFVFEKKGGKVNLLSSMYKKQDDASIQMSAVLAKLSDLPAFANLQFIKSGNNPIYLKFSNDYNFAISNDQNYVGAAWAGYYDLCKGAWKGKYNGVDYMGFTLIGDPGDPALMLVQKAGEDNFTFFKIR